MPKPPVHQLPDKCRNLRICPGLTHFLSNVAMMLPLAGYLRV